MVAVIDEIKTIQHYTATQLNWYYYVTRTGTNCSDLVPVVKYFTVCV